MNIPDTAIAVVGMAGKFPGANELSAFWANLGRGKESIVTLSEEELREAGVGDEVLADPAYVRRAPLGRRDRRIRRRLLRVSAAVRSDAGSPAPVVPSVRMACVRRRRL